MTEWNAGAYHRASSLQQAMAQEVLDRLVLESSERILDLGCGDGRITAELAARAPGASVVGSTGAKTCVSELVEYDQLPTLVLQSKGTHSGLNSLFQHSHKLPKGHF